MAKVEEFMNRDFFSVSPITPLIEVAEIILENRTSAVPVCENGKLCGVICDRDIITRIVENGGSLEGECSMSLMDKKYPVVSPSDDLLHAARMMQHNFVSVLQVAQDGKLVGILTLDDLAAVNLHIAATVICKAAKQNLRRRREEGLSIN